MIPNEEKEGWYYLLVIKNLSALRGRPLKHSGDFYCLNCLHSFATKIIKLKSHEKVCRNKPFCEIVLLGQKDNIY